MARLLHAGKNVLTNTPEDNLSNWTVDGNNPNMDYFRDHLLQVVQKNTFPNGGSIYTRIQKRLGSDDDGYTYGWYWKSENIYNHCQCPSLLQNILPIHPGYGNYFLWQGPDTNVNNLSGTCIRRIYQRNENGTVLGMAKQHAVGNYYNETNQGNTTWGSPANQNLEILENGVEYEFWGFTDQPACYVDMVPVHLQNFENEQFGPCIENMYYCANEFNSGQCAEGCISYDQSYETQFNNGDGTDLLLAASSDEISYEIYMDQDTVPFLCNIFNTDGTDALDYDMIHRGSINYTGTTLGGCAGCASGNYDFGFDDEKHCCAYRYGGSRSQYTHEHYNPCDKEIWPANNDGHKCYYPNLPPNSEMCGNIICPQGSVCAETSDPQTGDLQLMCVDNVAQDVSDTILYGRFAYNQTSGMVYEVYNTLGDFNLDGGEHISLYNNSFTEVCADASWLQNSDLTGDDDNWNLTASEVMALENLTITNDGLSEEFRVFDCYELYGGATGAAGTEEIAGCMDVTACNYNPMATRDVPQWCAGAPDCNGNCQKHINGNWNSAYGWEYDMCGICSDPTPPYLSSTAGPGVWIDECGKCLANSHYTIAKNLSGNTIGPRESWTTENQAEQINDGLPAVEPDGSVWYYNHLSAIGEVGVLTGDLVCEYEGRLEGTVKQCVGIEVDYRGSHSGDAQGWVHLNQLPQTGMMKEKFPTINAPYNISNTSDVQFSCPGVINYEAWQSCWSGIASDDDGPSASHWNNSCCEYSCNQECVEVKRAPGWSSHNFSGAFTNEFHGRKTTGCEIDWKQKLQSGLNITWNDNEGNVGGMGAPYGQSTGIPVQHIRAICGTPNTLPAASNTIQFVPFNHTAGTIDDDGVEYAGLSELTVLDDSLSNLGDSHGLQSGLCKLEDLDMDAIKYDEDINSGEYGDDLLVFFTKFNYSEETSQYLEDISTDRYNGWLGLNSIIPFVPEDDTPFTYQIVRITDAITGDYVTSRAAGENGPWLPQHWTEGGTALSPDNAFKFRNGRNYHIDVVHNPTGISIWPYSNPDDLQYFSLLGKQTIWDTSNELQIDTYNKIRCCTDISPENGLCDFPIQSEMYCNPALGGTLDQAGYAQHAIIGSCSELPTPSLDYYEGVQGDIRGCMDPSATNYLDTATFDAHPSLCRYPKPFLVDSSTGFNHISDYDYADAFPGIDVHLGRKFKKEITEDQGGYSGFIKVIDFNYGDHGEIWTLSQLVHDINIINDVQDNNNFGFQDQGILKSFRIGSEEDFSYSAESVFYNFLNSDCLAGGFYCPETTNGGVYWDAMVYQIPVVVQPGKNIFGNYTGISHGQFSSQAHIVFRNPLYSFRTLAAFEFDISNVDDYPALIQYTPNLLKESELTSGNWSRWARSEVTYDGSWLVEKNVLAPGANAGDEQPLENFVWNHRTFMAGGNQGAMRKEITHAKVYGKASSYKIPYNTLNELSLNPTQEQEGTTDDVWDGVVPHLSKSSTQLWQTLKVPSGNYRVSGWIRYVKGQMEYKGPGVPNGLYSTDTAGVPNQLYLAIHNHGWPWDQWQNYNLSQKLIDSYEQSGIWKYFEFEGSWLDNNYKCSAQANHNYSAYNDVLHEYASWPKFCSAGSGAECTYPTVENDSRGKSKNVMYWDGNWWRICGDSRDDIRVNITSPGSISGEDELEVGIYGLQFSRVSDYKESNNNHSKQFVRKENGKIIVPQYMATKDPTGGSFPGSSCDPSRVINVSTGLDYGDSSVTNESQWHNLEFNEIVDFSDIYVEGHEGSSVYNRMITRNNQMSEFESYFGTDWEVYCIEEGWSGGGSDNDGGPNPEDTTGGIG